MAAVMAARMVARLAGPLPVRLVAVSSWNVTSRMWWCADGPGSRMSRGQVLRGSVRAGQAGDGVDAQRSSPLNAQDVRGDVFADQGGAAFTAAVAYR